ncbi:GNAT family N-acetyltransferase [Actinomadura sp. B10D3]|uniref:GNAT family N-acetyltransferase n=1 Tax=Actinomadura sp. B10D3 TaxID=3153557 RepID=UPI00325C7FA9
MYLERQNQERPSARTADDLGELETVILRDDEATNFLRDQWSILYSLDVNAAPYLFHTWLKGWSHQLPLHSHPLIVLVMSGGSPVGALALVQEQLHAGEGAIRLLSTPYSESVGIVGPASDCMEVARAVSEALGELRREDNRVLVSDIPAASALARELASDENWSLHLVPYATVDLPLSFDSLSRETRRTHRRRLRKAEQLRESGHRLEFKRSRTTSQLLEAFEILAELDARQHSERPFSAGSWKSVLAECGSDLAFVATLELDDVPVAAELCLYREKRCYSVLAARDTDCHQFAAGHVLLRHLADDLADAGFLELDLGRTLPTGNQIGYKSQYGARWGHTIVAVTQPLEASASLRCAQNTVSEFLGAQ